MLTVLLWVTLAVVVVAGVLFALWRDPVMANVTFCGFVILPVASLFQLCASWPEMDPTSYSDTPWAYLWLWRWLPVACTAVITIIALTAVFSAQVKAYLGVRLGVWVQGGGFWRFWGPENTPCIFWFVVFACCVLMCWLYGLPSWGPDGGTIPGLHWLLALFGFIDDTDPAAGKPRYPRHWGWFWTSFTLFWWVLIVFILTHRDEAVDAWHGALQKARLRTEQPGVAEAVTAAAAPTATTVVTGNPPGVTVITPPPTPAGATLPGKLPPFGKGYWGLHILYDFATDLLAQVFGHQLLDRYFPKINKP